MKCKCGYQNSENAVFCSGCGRKLSKKKFSKLKLFLRVLLVCLVIALCVVLAKTRHTPIDPPVSEDSHVHTWKAATCTNPKMCIVCGESSGVAEGHQWQTATCTSPITCMVCGETIGTAASHQWVDATYTTPKTCKVCGTTTGSVKEKSLLDTPRSGLLAAGNYHSVHLYPNGRVTAEGRSTLSEYANKGTRLDVSSWSDIVAICASSHTVGLKADGTVVACGVNRYGQCDLSGWKDIVRIAVSDDHTVGLRRDGTVVAKGNNEYGQCDVSHWRNIMAIAATKTTTFGLTQDGTIVSAGRDHYGKDWCNVMEIYAGAYDLIGLLGNYSVIASGSCEKWDNNNMEKWAVHSVSASSTHIVGLRFDGTVVACGRESAAAACAVKNWKDIVQVSAGMYFTIGLKSDGTVVSCGDDVFGQLAIE